AMCFNVTVACVAAFAGVAAFPAAAAAGMRLLLCGSSDCSKWQLMLILRDSRGLTMRNPLIFRHF
ncbi:MAG TPA: hypothetical protein VGC88_06560, partial [Terriglobales bacterium]